LVRIDNSLVFRLTSPVASACVAALMVCLAAWQIRAAASPQSSQEPPARAASTTNASAPTYSEQIAPILFNRCSVCHHPNGAAPFSVLTYASVRQHATQIAELTKSHAMPPWKAEPGSGEYVGFEPLSDAEIDLIQRWAGAGAPEGDARLLPPPPVWNAEWQLGKPDLVVTLPEPYLVPPSGTDQFRIFVFRLPIDGIKYVRGIEFHPGETKTIHHATMRVDTTPTSRRLDADDPLPGYEGLLAHSASYPDGHFLGWTPGQVPPLLPKGLAWTLTPGTDFVVQLHLQPTGKPETIQPTIGFYFGSDPPERIPTMIRLSRQRLDIPAGDPAVVVTDSYVIPVDVEVQAVQPHAHFRGKDIEGFATLPDGTRKNLITIRDWDFRWQHVFRFVRPVPLPKGTKLEMRYTYDNSASNPRNVQPLVPVQWGQRSADEMADLWIQVLTANDRDRNRLVADFQPKMLAEDIIGTQESIRAEPTRVALHDDAALLYLITGQPQLAVQQFTTSVSLKPDSAVTHYNLGYALTIAATSQNPVDSAKLNDAVREYERAIELQPNYVAAHNNLGGVLLQRGEPARALTHLTEAVRLDPRDAGAIYNLGKAERALGNRAGAVEQFRQAMALSPNWAVLVSDLAWLLATSPEDAVRNGAEAVRFAQRAVSLTGGTEPASLDVLAAAYAEAGDFDRAVETAQLAMQHAPAGRGKAIISERLELYRLRKPYRQ
jgi:tetratricopeptide (TPR) repeat protein